VVAVANLEAYDFFPARGIALSHVRDEEKKWGIPILVDLKGTLGATPWNLPKKTSSVLLLDGSGKVVFRYSGRMKEEDMEAFFKALGTLLGRETPPGARP
jgi:predicted transcriptional regulator